jgi:hypothetical protein
VYYDGSSSTACGGGVWPPTLEGTVAGLYMRGAPGRCCLPRNLAGPGEPPTYRELSMLHEILHTLGFVARCAPHHVREGHVNDTPTDLIYAGDEPWRPSVLDAGHDDYYGHGNAGCLI